MKQRVYNTKNVLYKEQQTCYAVSIKMTEGVIKVARRKKLVYIQFSRALVPLMVMVFHLSESMEAYYNVNFLGLATLPLSGGVNYFFALTGFMMVYIYRNQFGETNQIKNYLLNRFIRIFPFYWVITLVFLGVVLFSPVTFWSEVVVSPSTILSSFLLLPNGSGTDPFLLVAWSLVYTVFFYIVFSLFFLSNKELSKWLMITWGALSLIFYTGLVEVHHFLFHFVFGMNSVIFLGGVLCAYLITHYQIGVKWAGFLAFVGIIGFPLTWLNYIHVWMYVDFDLSTGFFSALLIMGLASIDLQKTIRIPRFFNYLGNAAFAIYLTHNTVLDISMELYSRLSVYSVVGAAGTMIFISVLMLAVGCLAHSFVEKPLVAAMRKLVFRKPRVQHSPQDLPTSVNI